MKFPLKTSLAAITLLAATPAFADATLGTCVATDPSPAASFCVAVTGNANNGSPMGTAAELNQMLDDLGTLAGTDFGDVNWAIVDPTKLFFTIGGTGADAGQILNFAQTLFGEQIISIHFGGGGGVGGETIMYLFDFGMGGANWVDLNQASYSNAVLITPPGSPPPVPEPATWALMLVGFGVVGYTMRRRRKTIMPQVA
jgi:hypothetical protein